MLSARDESGDQYLSSSHAIKDRLYRKYGKPDVLMYKSNFDVSKLSGKANRGIMFMDLGKGTGHVDLNTGSQMFSNQIDSDY